MTAPNIINATSILGKTAVQTVSTSSTAILSNGAASDKVLKINSLIVANIDGAVSADITVELVRSAVAYRLASTITVPADAAIVVISKDSMLYLEEGDTLNLTASAAGDLQAVCSYEEIS